MPPRPIYPGISLPAVWAADARTIIPAVPVPGTSYRNVNISAGVLANGQSYDQLGNSADWNQLLYLMSANVDTMQKFGCFTPWLENQQYLAGANVISGEDGWLYTCTLDVKGTTDPKYDPDHWEMYPQRIMGEGLNMSNGTVTWGIAVGDPVQNLDLLTTSGCYNVASTTTNGPKNVPLNGIVVVYRSEDSNMVVQVLYTNYNTRPRSYSRCMLNKVWNLWSMGTGGGSGGGGGLPIGSVIAFSGTFGGKDNRQPIDKQTGEPLDGWLICDGGEDGNGGTVPDIRDRFILGASDTHPSGTTGGSGERTVGDTVLTAAQGPAHTHGQATGNNDGAWPYANGCSDFNGYAAQTNTSGGAQAHTHSISGEAALGPYYALAYIISVIEN